MKKNSQRQQGLRPLKILKFGGSSLGSAAKIRNVCKIIVAAARNPHDQNNCTITVVVSAMQGVTDKLLSLNLDWVREKHILTAKELKIRPSQDLLDELGSVIGGIKLIGDASPLALDLVASLGERLSAYLVVSSLNSLSPLKRHNLSAAAIDTREIIKTDSNFQNAAVDFVKTNTKIKNYFKKLPADTIPIATGFIASTKDGKTTTLGRGGSDYSASILGAALNVRAVEIWTDVNGVMSADPRIVPAAVTLPRITYEEAFEMSYFGAKVIYPPTMLPVAKKNIPIIIKNTFNPTNAGTIIQKQKAICAKGGDNGFVKNISAIDNISLVNVSGTSLVGVPEIASQIFKSISNQRINPVLISRSSSEHTICFAIKESDASNAISALKNEFKNDILKGRITINKKSHQSIVAIVGDDMRGVPGIAGKLFRTLGQNKISVSAIAQGASERNISFVINQDEKERAITCIHQEFFAGLYDTGIFLIGAGIVGSEFLRQVHQLNQSQTTNPKIRIFAIADSQKMLFGNNGINLRNWKKLLAKSRELTNIAEFIRRATTLPIKTKILVDCTADEGIVKSYGKFIKSGFHIATPNKKANALPIKRYHSLRETLQKYQKHFYYSANVGAGLPIISALQNLSNSGDKIKKVEGIFSGTLSYLFNNFSKLENEKAFSELVSQARQSGYTEPDPREDLSGRDVGRKLLILAREMGWPTEIDEIHLENLADYDDEYFSNVLKRARGKKRVLHYVGIIQNKSLSAKLREIDASDPLANVSGTDNLVAIYTKNYQNPLVIKGPGAGAAVTASAVLSDTLKIIEQTK